MFDFGDDEDSEESLWNMGSDEAGVIEQNTIAHDTKYSDLIMCCCQKDIKHDETMKFTIRVNNQEVLSKTLFA